MSNSNAEVPLWVYRKAIKKQSANAVHYYSDEENKVESYLCTLATNAGHEHTVHHIASS